MEINTKEKKLLTKTNIREKNNTLCIRIHRHNESFQSLKVYCFSSIIFPASQCGRRSNVRRSTNETALEFCLVFFGNDVCDMFRLRSPRSVSPQRPTQSPRPHSRNVSPSFADSTFSAVHAALNKRHVQVNYRIELSSSESQPSLFVVEFIREILDSTPLET